jgi:hypothetical protein
MPLTTTTRLEVLALLKWIVRTPLVPRAERKLRAIHAMTYLLDWMDLRDVAVEKENWEVEKSGLLLAKRLVIIAPMKDESLRNTIIDTLELKLVGLTSDTSHLSS